MSQKTISLLKDTKYDKYISNLLEKNFSDQFDFIFSETFAEIESKFHVNYPFLIVIDFESNSENIFTLFEQLKSHRKVKKSEIIFLIDKKNLSHLSSFNIEDFISKPTNKEEFIFRFSNIIKRVTHKYEKEKRSKEQKDLLKEKEKLNQVLRARDLALNKSAAVAVINKKGNILFINDKFCSLSKYSKHELIGKDFESILNPKQNDFEKLKTIWISIYRGEIWRGEICSLTRSKNLIWTDTSVSPIYDDNGKINKFFTVHFDITDRIKMEKLLQEKNYSVTKSINYASRIQAALFPSAHFLNEHFNENFVFYKPRDIVSGDFFWMKQISNITVVAIADCTGHGVPGAFMSVLGISFLNEIVTFRNSKIPSQILNEMRLMVKKSLHQEEEGNVIDDGMDITICSIERNKNKLYFAGAMNSIYIIRNKNFNEICGENVIKTEGENANLYQICGDEMPIGSFFKEVLFRSTVIDLVDNDIIIGFSDGIIDQFGGEKYKKFSSTKFKEILLNNYRNNISEFKEILQEEYEKWVLPKKYKQIDDILVIGVKY